MGTNAFGAFSEPAEVLPRARKAVKESHPDKQFGGGTMRAKAIVVLQGLEGSVYRKVNLHVDFMTTEMQAKNDAEKLRLANPGISIEATYTVRL